jgi:hypothetical protein
MRREKSPSSGGKLIARSQLPGIWFSASAIRLSLLQIGITLRFTRRSFNGYPPLEAFRRLEGAALFVADQLLSEDGVPSWDLNESPPIRKQLEAEGAVFEWRQLSGSYVYLNTWLKEALKVDPEGRAGELSFLTLMELGFETSGACTDQGGTGFNAVIREGEAHLQRKPASGFSADIHFLLGQAYGDIVVLVNGGGYSAEEERGEYKDKAPSARQKVLFCALTALLRIAHSGDLRSRQISRAFSSLFFLLGGSMLARDVVPLN